MSLEFASTGVIFLRFLIIILVTIMVYSIQRCVQKCKEKPTVDVAQLESGVVPAESLNPGKKNSERPSAYPVVSANV